MRAALVSIVACSILSSTPAAAQQPTPASTPGSPRARLVRIETLALDVKGRTIADLAESDFQLALGEQPMPLVSFDVLCPVGAVDDPVAHKEGDPPPPPIAPTTPRKIVLAVDYNYLTIPDRRLVLDAIASMVRMSKTLAEEIMLVALADGVRVEQRFTNDADEIHAAVRRMKHDRTLWGREFSAGAGEKGYFESLATLMDLLEPHAGAKVVVLFSTLLSTRDPNDPGFEDVAERATAARTAIYPNWAQGLQVGTPGKGPRALQRLASESGGRPPVATGDLSLQYRRAQRDLACRYLLGVELDDEPAATRRPVRVRVGRRGVILRYPERVRLRTEAEMRDSRLRAVFAEPEALETPLVRAAAIPIRPVDRQWDSLLVLQFPLSPGAGEAGLEWSATLDRGSKPVEQYRAPIPSPAEATGRSAEQSVTVTGDGSFKPGSYELTVALARTDDARVVSSSTPVRIPEIPKNGLFVAGPLLLRARPGGILIRGDVADAPNDTALDEILGEENFLEPLLVHEVAGADRFLAYWEACQAGTKNAPPEGSAVRRRFTTRDGIEAHALPPTPWETEQYGPLRCMHALDDIAPRTLRRGEYTLEISLEKPGGEVLARSSVPLRVN